MKSKDIILLEGLAQQVLEQRFESDTYNSAGDVKGIELTDEHRSELDDFMRDTIIQSIWDDFIFPDMDDVSEDSDEYDDIFESRENALNSMAIQYIKNNL